MSNIDQDAIAKDFAATAKGIMTDTQITNAVAGITNDSSTAYPANGSIASMIFYIQTQVNITSSGGKSFNGKGGGAFTPGGGALFGDVYSDNLTVLYANTVSFQITCTPVYVSIIFFDNHSNVLGTFQCGAVSTVVGVGGGSGSWS